MTEYQLIVLAGFMAFHTATIWKILIVLRNISKRLEEMNNSHKNLN
jgi:hypothetical protein